MFQQLTPISEIRCTRNQKNNRQKIFTNHRKIFNNHRKNFRKEQYDQFRKTLFRIE